jgi:hypothetical protein
MINILILTSNRYFIEACMLRYAGYYFIGLQNAIGGREFLGKF